jgi:large subunit ribosomal protein L25
MDQTVVTATTGRALGTRPSRRLRAEGKLPAVVYGLGKDPISVAVDYAELRAALRGDAGMNAVIQLDVEGAETETVIVRSVERHPLQRVVTHADFLRIDPNRKVRVRVPIHLTGEPTEVTSKGGLIEQQLFELEVEVAPQEIPTEILVDVSVITLDSRIAVADLALPAGVTTTVASEIAVVAPVISRAAKMGVADEEGVEGEEGEIGDEAEAAEGDEAEAAEGGEE